MAPGPGGSSSAPQPIVRKEGGVSVIYCPHPGCNRTFAKQANYFSHSRTHTGETPYACEICGQEFKWQSSQKAHMRAHERKRMKLAESSDQRQGPPSGPGPYPPSPAHGRDSQATLPAIRSQYPQDAPKVEPLEPPVVPQRQSRRDAKLVPIQPLSQPPGQSSHGDRGVSAPPPSHGRHPVPSGRPHASRGPSTARSPPSVLQSAANLEAQRHQALGIQPPHGTQGQHRSGRPGHGHDAPHSSSSSSGSAPPGSSGRRSPTSPPRARQSPSR